MKINLNNKQVESTASNLSDLLQEFKINTSGVALAVNGKVVSRTLWAETVISENDEVIVVSAVYGG